MKAHQKSSKGRKRNLDVEKRSVLRQQQKFQSQKVVMMKAHQKLLKGRKRNLGAERRRSIH
jgi:hypothetical protein